MKNPVADDLNILAQKHIEQHCPKLESLCREHSFPSQPHPSFTCADQNVRTDRYGLEFEKVYATLIQGKLRQVKAACNECHNVSEPHSFSSCDFSKPGCILKKLDYDDEAWNYIDRRILTLVSSEIVSAGLPSDYISFKRKSPSETVCIMTGARSEFETNELVMHTFRECRHEILLLPPCESTSTDHVESTDVVSEINLGCDFAKDKTISIKFKQIINTQQNQNDADDYLACGTLCANQPLRLLRQSQSPLSTLFWPPREWFIGENETSAQAHFTITCGSSRERTVTVHLPEFQAFRKSVPSFLSLDISLTLEETGLLSVAIVATDLFHHIVEIGPESLFLD